MTNGAATGHDADVLKPGSTSKPTAPAPTAVRAAADADQPLPEDDDPLPVPTSEDDDPLPIPDDIEPEAPVPEDYIDEDLKQRFAALPASHSAFNSADIRTFNAYHAALLAAQRRLGVAITAQPT